MALLLAPAVGAATQTIFIEAEGFDITGGWVIDQQFVDQMGSAFLLAHGMGSPVSDARTSISVPEAAEYRVWVRTRDWVATWKAPGAPGRFQLLVNGKPLRATFGNEGATWHWQDGGVVRVPKGDAELTLHDLAGFDGRCDAILLTTDTALRPPDNGSTLAAFRKRMLHLRDTPENVDGLDLVVVGGGLAGVTTAVSAARLGLKVALLQDRPILGGNSSSDIRVGMGGAINLQPYPAVGVVVAELDPGHPGNAQPAANYDDERKLSVVRAEKSIRLFLNTRAFAVEKIGNRVGAVIARDLPTGKEIRFTAPLFADCTGDGTIGYLAAADYRYGREGRKETGEPTAPEEPDRLVMGTSVMWYSEDAGKPVAFPETPWALQFDEQTVQRAARGDWDWETGQNQDQVRDAESIRDHALRAIYGNWSYQKNHAADRAKYENLRLGWVAYIGGKRESRRLMGDVILQEQDIVGRRDFPDASVTATWSIDLHEPTAKQKAQFPGGEFRSVASFGKKAPYAIPYRCFYSRNVENLFMAGRNISVTHVALGTVRVMRMTGMMGEVVGMAAAIARKHDTTPRGVYENYLGELKAAMTRGAGKSALAERTVSPPVGYRLAWSDEFNATTLDRTWAYRTDTKHWSTQLPSSISLRDCNLVIEVKRVTATGGTAYTGGGVISRKSFGYGYYESRFRIMAGKGWHSSFWLMKHDGSGSTNTTATDLELDIAENDSIDPKSYSVATHRWKGEHAVYGHKRVETLPLFDYHVYGCEYTPKEVKYYFDGELVRSVDIASQPQGEVNIWLTSIASHLGHTDAVDDGRLPGHIDFDYVRFYQKQ
jgi:hypothetical protein